MTSTAGTIEVRGLTKRFGPVAAVSDLTFRVPEGRVTGFLGPNGAGKTTTLRMLLGLVTPTAGTATIGGVAYRDLPHPTATVGTALEAASFHPGRTARGHLRVHALASGIPSRRIDEVLDTVGLTQYADRRVGGYSLGMRQRLGLATALLGDPRVLVLDEPVNGLDPEGIRWIRTFLRDLASEGRTVLISSHLLSEVQQSVDQLVIISKGRLVFEGDLSDLDTDTHTVTVDAPDRAALAAAVQAAGGEVTATDAGLTVRGLDPTTVGAVALTAGVALSHLSSRGGGLEQSFLDLVGDGTATDARTTTEGGAR